MEIKDPESLARERIIAGWLFAVCAMIYVMVLIGGLTRLTYSGLSMVEWKPLTGWLPPLSPEAWEAAFAKYREFPEYRELNMGMSLDEFRFIFLMEYAHRLWGRLIGVVFLVPFVYFFIRGWIDARLLPRLLAMFILGGLQGVLGWYMVQSGLVDEPDVSPYRLTAHLGFAILIYAYIFWVALGLWRRPAGEGARLALPGLRRLAAALPVLVFVTILSGGFMAGINGGFAYNTFPTMDGEWIPEGLFSLSPFFVNFFEDVTTVQFNHRMLAYGIVIVAIVFWFYARPMRLSGQARLAINCVPVFALSQAALGILTLLLIVPTPLAAMHQAGGVALLTVTLWSAHSVLRR